MRVPDCMIVCNLPEKRPRELPQQEDNAVRDMQGVLYGGGDSATLRNRKDRAACSTPQEGPGDLGAPSPRELYLAPSPWPETGLLPPWAVPARLSWAPWHCLPQLRAQPSYPKAWLCLQEGGQRGAPGMVGRAAAWGVISLPAPSTADSCGLFVFPVFFASVPFCHGLSSPPTSSQGVTR